MHAAAKKKLCSLFTLKILMVGYTKIKFTLMDYVKT